MKTLISTISLVLLGLGIVKAQDKSSSEVTLTEKVKQTCNLTPEQVTKVQPIIADFEKTRDDSYQKYRSNPDALSKAVRKNRWDYETKLIGILTPEQMGTLKAFDQRNPGLMKGNGQSGAQLASVK